MTRLSLPAMTQTQQLPCIFLSLARCATQYMMMDEVRTRPIEDSHGLNNTMYCHRFHLTCPSQ